MDLLSLAMEAAQTGAERAASFRLGQSALRQLDRALWVVEKCARWAVPPPLDQDERPQPELVRPLPWVFFLMMLVALRVTRESISLLNLVMGKPPLRSADVVMYIQGKRRYLRTLKYQGTRLARLRVGTAAPAPHAWLPWSAWLPWVSWGAWGTWPGSLASMLQLTMCFRRHPLYANNNTTTHTNNDEVLVVKRSKRGRETPSPVVSASETTMERLIEKMMVDLDADSDEDSGFTLTNVTTPKSDRSDFTVESDKETFPNDTHTTQEQLVKQPEEPQNTPDETHNQEPPTTSDTQHPQKELTTTQNDTQKPQNDLQTAPNDTKKIEKELPTTNDSQQPQNDLQTAPNDTKKTEKELPTTNDTQQPQNDLQTAPNDTKNTEKELPTTNDTQQPQNDLQTAPNDTKKTEKKLPTTNDTQQPQKELLTTQNDTKAEDECEVKVPSSTPEKKIDLENQHSESNEIPKELFSSPDPPLVLPPNEETQIFLQMEASSKIPRTSNNEPKIANGRTVKGVPSKKKGAHVQAKDRRNSERAAKNASTNNSM